MHAKGIRKHIKKGCWASVVHHHRCPIRIYRLACVCRGVLPVTESFSEILRFRLAAGRFQNPLTSPPRRVTVPIDAAFVFVARRVPFCTKPPEGFECCISNLKALPSGSTPPCCNTFGSAAKAATSSGERIPC